MSVEVFSVGPSGVYPTSGAATKAAKDAILSFFTSQGFTGGSTSVQHNGFKVRDLYANSDNVEFYFGNTKYESHYSKYAKGSGSEYTVDPFTVYHVTTTNGEYWAINSLDLFGVGKFSDFVTGEVDSVTSNCQWKTSSGSRIWRDVSSTTSPGFSGSLRKPFIKDGQIYVSLGYLYADDLRFKGAYVENLQLPDGYTLNEIYQSDTLIIFKGSSSSAIYIYQLPF